MLAPHGIDPSHAPAGFRAAYRSFLREGRILLTGHSHQAWPDVAREAQARAFDDAAAHVDDKWEKAVDALLAKVARGVAVRLGYRPEDADSIVFGQNTHELVFRLLSCWPFDASTRIVTTTGEFHSLDRQLRRLQEAGVGVDWVDARARAGLERRVVDAIEPGTSIVALSAVLFEDGWVLRDLEPIARRAQEVGAALLVDAYHAFNVVPLPFASLPGEVWVVAGGYKYAQFGEACCFMRVPPGTSRTPLQTGWFSDFADLAQPRELGARPVGFGPGASRFKGSTFDATPFYRAAAVLDHFDAHGLDPGRLRAISSRQTRRLLDRLEALDARGAGLVPVSSDDNERRGGFVALRFASPQRLVEAARAAGVFVDARGDIVRLGPAPYLLDDELDEGARRLVDAARSLTS
ncbi:MAG TPA: aminotransferase class V-fold PLP-dependent enzyme [Vulgatibacter sp.]|nr:aminotransferase class V-fold PLP-dependent enzyme [Vulgatibacter sp.]